MKEGTCILAYEVTVFIGSIPFVIYLTWRAGTLGLNKRNAFLMTLYLSLMVMLFPWAIRSGWIFAWLFLIVVFFVILIFRSAIVIWAMSFGKRLAEIKFFEGFRGNAEERAKDKQETAESGSSVLEFAEYKEEQAEPVGVDEKPVEVKAEPAEITEKTAEVKTETEREPVEPGDAESVSAEEPAGIAEEPVKIAEKPAETKTETEQEPAEPGGTEPAALEEPVDAETEPAEAAKEPSEIVKEPVEEAEQAEDADKFAESEEEPLDLVGVEELIDFGFREKYADNTGKAAFYFFRALEQNPAPDLAFSLIIECFELWAYSGKRDFALNKLQTFMQKYIILFDSDLRSQFDAWMAREDIQII